MVQLIRSKRRSIALQVRPDGALIVRAPYLVRDSVIEKFVQEKRDWISKVQQSLRQQSELVRPKQFIEGEKFLYLGNEYSLHIAEDMFGKLLFEDRFILGARYLPKARKIFESWYRNEAFFIFTQRCQRYAQQIGVSYQGIKLSNAKHRWGSCHPSGNLCFNWRLVMGPQAVIDYVVVHELAHLKELNHSSRFWSVVEKTLPDYRVSRKWLKDNHFRLNI